MLKPKYEFTDLHPVMRQYITHHLLATGIITIAATVLLSIILTFRAGAVVLLGGVLYAAYLLFLLLSFLCGRGDMYEGVIIKGTGPSELKSTRFKDGKKLIANHTTLNTIRIRSLTDDKIIELRVKGTAEYNVGCKVTLFTPSNSAFKKANDLYFISSYYKIIKDFEDVDDYIKSSEENENAQTEESVSSATELAFELPPVE